MRYVNCINRISALDKALERARTYADRHPDTDIDYAFGDKMSQLKKELRDWRLEANRANRRKQIITACRLLSVDVNLILYRQA